MDQNGPNHRYFSLLGINIHALFHPANCGKWEEIPFWSFRVAIYPSSKSWWSIDSQVSTDHLQLHENSRESHKHSRWWPTAGGTKQPYQFLFFSFSQCFNIILRLDMKSCHFPPIWAIFVSASNLSVTSVIISSGSVQGHVPGHHHFSGTCSHDMSHFFFFCTSF